MKEEYIKLTLPIPPSVNICYTWKQKRVKSNTYKNWIQDAEFVFNRQTQYTISGNNWLEAKLEFNLPLYCKNWNKKKQDLDNLLKPLFDFLWDHLKWFKDEYIKSITAEKVDGDEKIVNIIIREIEWTDQTA
jgi:Holliday junction resolvase RusA-like endonuclease